MRDVPQAPPVSGRPVPITLAAARELAHEAKMSRLVPSEGAAKPIVKDCPTLRHYRELAESPRLIAIVDDRDGSVWAGWQGDEPATEAAFQQIRTELGCGGQGFKFQGFDGELTITHNLWSFCQVPNEYRHLFTATHEAAGRLTADEERAYWANRQPDADFITHSLLSMVKANAVRSAS